MLKRMNCVWCLGLACFGAMTLHAAETQPAVTETAPAQAVWLTDFAAAKKEAAEKKLPILMDFTGSDWCGWCIKLDKEVFSQPEFLDYAKDNLVLLKIDFPRKTKLPAAEAKANQKLLKAYNVKGFPTIILVNSDGKTMMAAVDKPLITGYKEGGAANYVAHLKALIDSAVK